MPSISLPSVGQITLRKSSRAKRMIIRIGHDGVPVVTVPRYIPYAAAKVFAMQHSDWIKQHARVAADMTLRDGQRIGRHHRLKFKADDILKTRSRVQAGSINITYPLALSPNNSQVQSVAHTAAIRAIRSEAEALLPTRLHELATRHGYKYKQVSVKNMRSRWGSCSSAGSIALSIWLCQLPDELIEYVCCHELAHLNHPHHQKSFWRELANMIPDYQQRRKNMKLYYPRLKLDG